MSSNHLKYDTCAYATTIKESTSQLEYWLYRNKYETCDACSNGDFTNNIDFPDRADVESELFGLTRPGTDCPSLKYDPSKSFNNPAFSPPIMCHSIYGITPSNLVNPTTNMLNENNLGVNLCSLNINPNIEQFNAHIKMPHNKTTTRENFAVNPPKPTTRENFAVNLPKPTHNMKMPNLTPHNKTVEYENFAANLPKPTHNMMMHNPTHQNIAIKPMPQNIAIKPMPQNIAIKPMP